MVEIHQDGQDPERGDGFYKGFRGRTWPQRLPRATGPRRTKETPRTSQKGKETWDQAPGFRDLTYPTPNARYTRSRKLLAVCRRVAF